MIKFIKDKLAKSHAICEWFTLILHMYDTIWLHNILRENNQHIITSK